MVYVGVDVGGTSLKAGVVNENGEIIARASCPTLPERGAEPVIYDMADIIIKSVENAGLTMDDVASVGIGIPGIENPVTHVVPICTNLYWRDVPLTEILSRRISKPIYIGNDATVAGFAEYKAGVSRGTDSSVFITLGTGVGGGIVINGKPWSGFHGVGSEIGHIITVAGGEMCTCGNAGCWERYASATAIIRMGNDEVKAHPNGALARKAAVNDINAKTVIDLAKAGDPACAAIFKEYVHNLCVGIVSIINMIDPEMIVLGGGVSHTGAFLLDSVNEELKGMIFCKHMPWAKIELASLGNDAGIIGAAMLGQ